MIILREIQPEDADQFLSLKKQLDHETNFMLLEPGERQTSLEQVEALVERILAQDNQTIIVAEIEGKLVGYLSAEGGSYQRSRHTVYIVIGIMQEFSGRGIGTQLFRELDDWASEHDIHRLELTVMAHNERALALYKKAGFEIEGMKRQVLRVDGQFVDEYLMGKLLD